MTALLVPIQLDALVVRAGGDEWSLTALDIPKPAARSRKRQKLVPDPFQPLDPARPPGAYLHWALPDALTRSTYDPVRKTHRFPAVPDRWLIVRLSGPANPRSLHAWLIPDAWAQEPVTIDPLAGDPLPAPGPAPAQPLTAAGHGDLAWAAYFDNVEGRLAIYDDLAGVAAGPVAYLVCGWYTDPAHDPVALAADTTGTAPTLEEEAWTFPPEQLPSGVTAPSSVVLHGAAVSIGWPDADWAGDGGSLGHEDDHRPDPAGIAAGLGETVTEALAALSAETSGQAPLVEGLLAGALGALDRPDGAAQLDTALHVTRFGSKPSPQAQEWIWQPAPTTAAPPAGGGSSGSGLDVDEGFRSVKRTRPRVWHAHMPEIVLSGAGRSFRHGGDGRFSPEAALQCRIEGATVTEFGVEGGDPGSGAAVLPAGSLAGLAAYAAPDACAALLVELACVDPGSAPDLASATATAPSPVAAQRAQWWAIRDPGVEPAAALAGSHVTGALPSPIAVTPPARPWVPVHLEWTASYLPSPRGAHDWELGESDFKLPGGFAVPDADPDHPLEGRMMLSATPATVLSGAAVVTSQGDGTTQLGGPSDPAALAASLADSDLLSGAFLGITEQLRNDPAGVVVRATTSSATGDMSLGSRPEGFIALRAGFMRIDKLRLVDGYGQFLDLLPGTLPIAAGPGVATPGHDDLVALKPRFTAPARVLLRYAAASGDEVDADAGVSPLCGFVAPSPLDGTLEFFDDTGGRLGRLRPDDRQGTAWEEDPGQDVSLGSSPSRAIPNQFLGAFADALLAADVGSATGGHGAATALRALVEVMDTTRWTVDVSGRGGDEHLALLLGTPVAVMRATLLLDVQDPRHPAENAAMAVPVKLGTLSHLSDGLLAYVVGDEPRVRVVDAAVAEATTAVAAAPPFVDPSDVFYVQPGTPVPLTLFVVPHADVHVTQGLVPQKAVGMLREWTAPALAKLSPALRYGPVLHDAKTVRMPVPSDVRGIWSWNRRGDQTSWNVDEVVTALADSVLGADPAVATEGWLSVQLIPDTLYTTTAKQVQITHILTHGKGSSSQLLGVGGTNADGSPFVLPTQQAARLQESGRFAFYIEHQGFQRRDIHVITMRNGTKYLRTTHDKHRENNLLALPEVPEEWLSA